MTRLLVLVYLTAIIAANASVAHFGPRAAVYNGFALIGLDLVTRDRLHDYWRGRALWLRMAALIVTGGALSFLFAFAPFRIAVASSLAFAAAAAVDSLVYHAARRAPWLERVNASNLAGAAVDSLVFIGVAFGLGWGVAFVLFVAKVAGGLVWSLLLARVLAPKVRLAPARS